MTHLAEPFAVRDPVHGLISFNALEWEIVNSAPFQRLRRIKQLAWTDYVYPGASHTRFEHSLGVCKVATRLFDAIVQKQRDLLQSKFSYNETGLARQRQIIRLAALTHDLGHGPFSHAAEEALPLKESGDRYTHEEYSAAFVKIYIDDILKSHPENKNNYGITYSDVASIFDGGYMTRDSIVWKELVSGQMDADRMDYLLRDAYHTGVSYGRFDIDRVINTICICEENDGEDSGQYIGVEEDGIHALEGLIIARYMMFTQVYFHKTRVIYDYHYEEALKECLRDVGGAFPPPTSEGLREYLAWDDWRVQALLSSRSGDANCAALLTRDHFRLIYKTSENPTLAELAKFDAAAEALDGLGAVQRNATKSWYKFQRDEIRVKMSHHGRQRSVPLAQLSSIVKGLVTVNQNRLYVPRANRGEAGARLEKL